MREKSSIINVISNVISIILLIAILAVLVGAYLFKDSNSAPSFFGYNIYIMNGTAMEPYVLDDSAVFVKTGEISENPINKVLLCNVVDGDLTTVLGVHSVEIAEDNSKTYIMRSYSGNQRLIAVPEEKIIGEAVFTSQSLGDFIIFATSQVGVILFVVIPGIVLLIIQLIKILRKIHNDEEEDEFTLNTTKPSVNAVSRPVTNANVSSNFGKNNAVKPVNSSVVNGENKAPLYRKDEFVKRPSTEIPVQNKQIPSLKSDQQALQNKVIPLVEREKAKDKTIEFQQVKEVNSVNNDELEFVQQVPIPVKITVDERGVATYQKEKEPTASSEELNKHLVKNSATSTNSALLSSGQTAVLNINVNISNESSSNQKPKEFQFKASKDDIKQVKNPPLQASAQNKKIDAKTALPPVKRPQQRPPAKQGQRPSNSGARKKNNQQIEELMALLNKNQKKS